MSEAAILLEHNLKTYNDAKEILKEHRSVAIVQPTGTGKSYIMMQFLHDYADMWKIVVAPSRLFLDDLQRNKFWVANKTVVLTYTWLVNHMYNLENKLRELGVDINNIGLIAFDEIHRAGADKWGEASNMLIDINKEAKFIGLTATPIRYNDNKDVIADLFGGRSISNMSLAKAINLGILPKLTYIIGMLHIDTELEHIEGLINKHKEYKILQSYVNDVRSYWNFDEYFVRVLNKYVNKNGYTHKHIVFTTSVEEANRLEDKLKGYFERIYPGSKVNTYKIHCELNHKINKETIEKFQSSQDEVSVAIVVNMLNESFHMQNVNSIILMRGTNSPNAYIQQIGRALSVDGQPPLVFDFVDNLYSVGEVFKNFNIPRKRSKVERIDLENKNWFNNKSYYDRELRDKAKTFIVDSDVDNGIFKEIIDEASDIEDKIKFILKLCNSVTDNTFEVFKDYLSETECNTIYGIKDKDKFNWCKWVIENRYSKSLSDSERDVYTRNYKILQLSDYIMYVGKEEWYRIYKLIIQGKASEHDIKVFEQYNIERFIRNLFNKDMANELESHGLYIDITKDEEKLKYYYNLHKKGVKNTIRDRIDWITEDNIKRNPFLYNKICASLEIMLSDVKYPGKHIVQADLGNAFAYKYFLILKERMDKYIDDNNIKASKDDLYNFEIADKLLRQSIRSNSIISEISDLKEYDRLFMRVNNMSDLGTNIEEYFKFKSFVTLTRIKNAVLKACSLFVYTKRVREKIDYLIVNSLLNADELGKIKAVMNIIHADYGNYEWCDEIQKEYNNIIDYFNRIEAYVNGNGKPEDNRVLSEYINMLQSKEKMDKSRKDYSKGIVIENETNKNITRRFLGIENFKDIDTSIALDVLQERVSSIKEKCSKQTSYSDDTYECIINTLAFVQLLLDRQLYTNESDTIPKEIKKIIGYILNQYSIVYNNTELLIYSEYKLLSDFITNISSDEMGYLAGCTMGIQDRKFYLRSYDKMESGEFMTYQEQQRLIKLIDTNYTKSLGIILESSEITNRMNVFNYMNTALKAKLA
ncbi:MAG: DEAD/DEAH box helicase family protein [Lachnospiraceae bacterium]|nr:DEAD/DEAH box helicase family protein [Lachnospiraceae bacterium]